MASLNLAGKTSGYVKLTAPDDSSTNPTVTLPTESGELALKSDIGEGGEKEAVVFEGYLAENLNSNGAFVKVNLSSKLDTKDSYNNSLHQFNPKTEGYYQVNVLAKALYNASDETIADVQIRKNGETSPVFIATDVSKTSSAFPTASSVVYLNGTTDYLEMYVRHTNGGDFQGSEDFNFTSFSAHLITGQSSGGSGTGGGETTDILPVLMTGRIGSTGTVLYGTGFSVTVSDTNKYTVTFDKPLTSTDYSVTATANSGASRLITARDKDVTGFVLEGWNGTTGVALAIDFVVTGTKTISVGGGSGGKTVAFRGELSVDQAVESGNWTKVELDTASVDTDNAFADGKFQPSVSGYYQVSTAVSRGSGTGSTGITSAIYKNGSVLSYGSNVDVVTPAQSSRSVSSDIVYLNGTTDYIELWTKVIYSSGGSILGKESHTFLSAVLVSGGSGTGDSARVKALEARLDKLEAKLKK